MITTKKAQQDYEAAASALQAAAMTPGMSSAERMTIRDTIRELTFRYLGQLEAEIHALTSQYQDFMTSMSSVVEGLKGGATPVSTLNRLTGIVQNGTKLIEAATEASPVVSRAFRGSRKRSAAGPARPEALRILCVHGVGHQEADPAFEGSWQRAINRGLAEWTLSRPFEIEFVAYDDLFAADPPNAADVAKAVFTLGTSGIIHGIGDLFRRRRGIGDLAESVRWTAGMVVQWAENETLRAKARQRVLTHTAKFKPHVILTHSLGSLLTYDSFARSKPEIKDSNGKPVSGSDLIAGRTLVTFGSQIGNPFVCSTLGGRIQPLPSARQWFHLYNPHDDAFTARIRLAAENFEQIDATFDIEGMLDHDAGAYLGHANTTNIVWRSIAADADGMPAARGVPKSALVLQRHSHRARPAKLGKPRRRALLVGINDYPDPADRLEGCVNDVFLMSSLLQEAGFAADDIRVVLNERATAKGILERLEWLLEGTQDGQERVFYYSGHGAQIPAYGAGDIVDGKDECLVAHDFDWSHERAVSDDQFYELYSQLPYGTQFLAIFDCCHSGGLTRDGGARVRGLTPPDDIRHRELKWDAGYQMWVPRDFKETSRSAKRLLTERADAKQDRYGSDGAVRKLGVAADLRRQKRTFEAALRDFDHKGPYMPVLLQACQENQFSYEYRHGVQSYGAFTYSLSLALRSPENRRKKPTWAQLTASLTRKLKELKYDQTPNLVCPTEIKTKPVPWKLK